MAGIHTFVNLLFIIGLVKAAKKRSTTTSTTTERNYVFEGVDYELMPEDMVILHNDCDGQHHKCIRGRTYFHPVCGYDIRSRYYEDFYSPCELELYNCRLRVQNGYGVFGTDFTNDYIFYNGEELNCLYYYRRSKNAEQMDVLYFGGNPPYKSLPTPEKYLFDDQPLTRTKSI